jgi:putative glycosyltransferase
MNLSIVTSLYYSSEYIKEFYDRITVEANAITNSYEIIFVNDGSPDNSLEIVRKLSDQDFHIKIIDLSRNYGQHRALMCGLEYSQGDFVFLTSVDLEEQPEFLSELWRAFHKNEDIDVVIGKLDEKPNIFFKKLYSNLFYKLFNFASKIKISSKDTLSRLMSRNYVNAVKQYSENDIFLPAIWEDVGFRQIRIHANKSYKGKTSYTLLKKINMAINAITSFSNMPLVYIFYVGLIFTSASIIFMIYLIIRKLFFGVVFQGWTSIITSLFLIGGIIIFSLGIIGIYLSKIFTQVKLRPKTLVKKIYNKNL